MNDINGACEPCRESMEGCITGEVTGALARDLAKHLAECEECAELYGSRQELIHALRGVPEAIDPVRPVYVPAGLARPQSGRAVLWWRMAAAAAAALAVMSISALTVPAFAVRIPGLPIGEKIERLEAERDRLEVEKNTLNERVEELEIEMKEIGGVKVPVVDTAGEGGVAPEVNDAVQRLGMEFISAQYGGDADALKKMATERLAAEIDRHPSDYVKKPGAVVFAQMTTVGKTEDGTLLLFVRLSDAEFSDSTYQEDFEIKFENGRYLVDVVGMDA